MLTESSTRYQVLTSWRLCGVAPPNVSDLCQVLRSEAERLRNHSFTTAANVAATEAGLRREVEALQAALERAQDSTAYRYDDHDTHVEKELAAARGDVVRLQSEARRFQVRSCSRVFCMSMSPCLVKL